MKLDTTKYAAMVANAAARVKISSTVFKNFIADVKSVIDGNDDVVTAHLAETVSYMTNVIYTPAVGTLKVTLPFKAKSIKIDAINNGTNQISWGMWAENGDQGSVYTKPSTGVYANNSAIAVVLEDGSGNILTGTIQNIVNDGFDILWGISVGSLISGSLRLKILATTH